MDVDEEWTMASDEQQGIGDAFKRHIAIAVAIIIVAAILTAAMEISAGNW
jgi:hypothetical protein